MNAKLDWRFTPFDYQGKLMGEIVSADGTSEAIFSEGDVAEIVRFSTPAAIQVSAYRHHGQTIGGGVETVRQWGA